MPPAPDEVPIIYPGSFTEKQRTFCEHYAVHCNATRAAIDAGYSEKTAYAIGAENLRKPQIRDVIQQMLERDRHRVRFHKDELIEGLREIWESSVTDFCEEETGGLATIGPENPKRRVIKELVFTDYYDDTGTKTRTKKTLKMHDRLAAGRMIMDILGYKTAEAIDLTRKVSDPEELTDEELLVIIKRRGAEAPES